MAENQSSEREPQEGEHSRQAYEDADIREKMAGARANELADKMEDDEFGSETLDEELTEEEEEEAAAKKEKKQLIDKAHDEAKKEDQKRKQDK